MKLRKAFQLLAAMALVLGLSLPAAVQAAPQKGESPGKKKGAGKKRGSGKCAAKGGGKTSAKPRGKGKGNCKKGKGKGVGGEPGANAADCSNPGGAGECFIDVWVRQGSPTTGAICSSFDNRDGECIGSSTGTRGWRQPGFVPKQGIGTWFSWSSPGGGAARNVEMLVKASFTITESFIRGNVPSSGSSTFNVTDAWNRDTNAHWKSVSKGADPGLVGGPLYIDYSHEILGSYVHMFGYLVRQ